MRIDELEKYSLQEIFDYVRDHLIKQGQPAMLEDSPKKCAYRGANGTKCAVGCLIPDDLYDPSFEGKSFRFADELAKLRPKSSYAVELLGSLQAAHDDGADERECPFSKADFNWVAAAYGLENK